MTKDADTPKMLFEWLMNAYGFLVPLHHAMTGAEFAASIRGAYDCGPTGAGPINETAAKFAEQHAGSFAHLPDRYEYRPVA